MDPRLWQVRVQSRSRGAEVVVTLNVDAYGQIVTSSERAFWVREIRRIEAAVHGEAQLPMAFGAQGALARVENWMLTAIPVSTAVAVGGALMVLGMPLLAVVFAISTLVGMQLLLFGWALWRPLTPDERLD